MMKLYFEYLFRLQILNDCQSIERRRRKQKYIIWKYYMKKIFFDKDMNLPKKLPSPIWRRCFGSPSPNGFYLRHWRNAKAYVHPCHCIVPDFYFSVHQWSVGAGPLSPNATTRRQWRLTGKPSGEISHVWQQKEHYIGVQLDIMIWTNDTEKRKMQFIDMIHFRDKCLRAGIRQDSHVHVFLWLEVKTLSILVTLKWME